MNIVVFEIEDWEREAFEGLQDEHDVILTAEALSAENAADYADAEIVSTFIYSQLDRDVLKQLEDVQLIATRSTGFDHIDTDYCGENDICVCNVPSYGKNTVAEHVFALLLTVQRHLYEAVDRTRKGDFSMEGLEGCDLKGLTLGVIGTGDIGRETIRIARGFSMNVIAYDVVHHDDAAEELGFDYVELDELLGRSDVITLHVPANDKTRHMLSDEQFGRMKDGVVLINTARGEVVDTQALVKALAGGKVRAAGLDVLPEEPVIREEAELLRSLYRQEHNMDRLLADHVLMRLRNVIVTPHTAFNTRQAIGRILETTRENIRSFVDGETINCVAGPCPAGAER